MPDIQSLSTETKQIAPKTILIVEDDPSIGEMFIQFLSDESIYTALLAADGAGALEVVKGTRPDLFLLDYHLPNMTGLELYDRLHAIKELELVPAILITAGVLQYDIRGRHIVGMSKPVDLNKLLDIIAELLD